VRVLLDTSVLVAALVEAHPEHARALPGLKRARGGRDEGVVAAHSIAETYSVLTALPHRPRITGHVAHQAIHDSILSGLVIQSLAASDYREVIRRLSGAGLVGGVTSDALVARAAERARVDRLVTLNASDFRRLSGIFEIQLEMP
jgi:predicted nucleic acid-binding protein